MIKAWADRADLTLFETATGIGRYWLAYGAALPAAIAGLAAGAATGSRRTVVHVTGNLWAEMASGFTGIDMKVKGEENLWSSRPCVFMFNHQSACEGFLGMRLLRRDVFAIAKKEVREKPVVGRVLDLLGLVYVDRDNRASAIAALRPAVQAVREGRSMVIAPEGTRSRDGRLGPFKKGGFHVAMEAGVPIVPIVFHDSIRRLRPGSGIARPGMVRVTVLPPVSTKGWKSETLERHMAEVRGLFLKTLGQKEKRAASRSRRRQGPSRKATET